MLIKRVTKSGLGLGLALFTRKVISFEVEASHQRTRNSPTRQTKKRN